MTQDVANRLAHTIIPGLPKLARTALAPASFERDQWAARLNRAQGTGKPCKVSYSHRSLGHYDVDGYFREFGGPMLFSAWCECGRFRYHGEEIGRRYAVKAHKAWVALGVNDVVTYHGSQVQHHDREFVITAVKSDRLSMMDVEWGDISLRNVHRASIEATERHWTSINCGHPRCTRRSSDGKCMTYGCTDELST